MVELFSTLYVVVAVIVLFGAAVFVHEYGHFWMARRRGLKILEFSIGFGPKIFGWKDKYGVDWSWRWIPAGGYVKLPQMITSESLEGSAEACEKLPPVTPFSKILVAVAGPFMNVVFAFAIAFVLWPAGIPRPINPSLVGHVPTDSEEYRLGVRSGDRIVAINGKPLDTWEEVIEFVALAQTNQFAVSLAQKGVTNTLLLTAQSSPVVNVKMLNLDPVEHPVVKAPRPNTAASDAGIKPEDKIVSFAQVPIASREQLINLVETRAGKATELVLKRDGQDVKLEITPRAQPTTGKGFLGIEFKNPPLRFKLQRPAPNPWVQVEDVVVRTFATINALVHSKKTGVGAKDLAGPVGIFGMLALQVKTDWRLALSFMVLLNINLAVLNLLPIPVLDGGHIVMAILEKIRGRPLSLRLIEYTTTVFAVLLLSFFLYVTVYDIKRIPVLKSLFSNESQVEQVQPTPAPQPAPTKP
jgi:regulator of sigma E protease